jgi:hypothetical protein
MITDIIIVNELLLHVVLNSGNISRESLQLMDECSGIWKRNNCHIYVQVIFHKLKFGDIPQYLYL